MSCSCVLLFDFKPFTNYLTQPTVDLVLVITVTTWPYDARTRANETLVFFRPFNDSILINSTGHFRDSSILAFTSFS